MAKLAFFKQIIGMLIIFAIAPPAALSDNAPAPVERSSTEIPMEARLTPNVPANTEVRPILIKAEINDQFVGTFLVDTGSDFSAITASTAAKLQLVPQPRYQNSQPCLLNGRQENSVQISSFRIGRFAPAVDELIVLRDDYFSSLIGSGIDGIVGANAFVGCAVEFDFPQQKIVLWYPGRLSDTDLKTAGFASSDGLQLGLESDSDRVTICVNCLNLDKETDEDLEVDTGASQTIISNGSAHDLQLEPQDKAIKFNSGNLGEYSVSMATVDSLTLGSFALHNQTIGYPAKDLRGFIPLLGRDVMTKGPILIDYPAMKMYFAPSP